MNLFNFLIENEHFLHNYIYESFKFYLKDKNISENDLYFENADDPKRQNTFGIIRDFIDYNYKTWSKRYSGAVKKEASYIQDYLMNVYFLDCLPF